MRQFAFGFGFGWVAVWSGWVVGEFSICSIWLVPCLGLAGMLWGSWVCLGDGDGRNAACFTAQASGEYY